MILETIKNYAFSKLVLQEVMLQKALLYMNLKKKEEKKKKKEILYNPFTL